MSINRKIKEKFSTFFDVEEQHNKLKITNLQKVPKLAKNFHNVFQSCPEGKAEYFAKKFVKQLQTNNQTKLDEEHLSAYLEESCFWLATEELSKQLRPLKYTELDCFQEARKIASEPRNIFKRYNFIDSNVTTWGKLQIKNKVKQTAYLGKEICKYATWSLPKYLSEKILREALYIKLQVKGKKEIESYVLAIKSYKKVYHNSQLQKIDGKLPEPNHKQWEEIKNYYNLRCSGYNNKLSSDESQPLEIITNFQEIKEKIITCVKVARDYCCIVEDIDINLTAIIRDSQTEIISLNHQEKEIEAEEKQQIVSVCLYEFSQLPPEFQKLIQLFYGLEISQTEMSDIFGFKQYQISRKIKRCEEKLLIALVKWSQENLGIIPNEEVLKKQNQPLKEWLRHYFKEQFYQVLQKNILEQQQEKVPMLRLYYGEGLKQEAVAEKLNLSPQIVAEEIGMVSQNLQTFLQQWVKEKMDIYLSKSTNKKIADFVEEWLNIAPYAMWH